MAAKTRCTGMAQQIASPYILPVHYDLPGSEAAPQALNLRLQAKILDEHDWHFFRNKQLVNEV